MKLQGSIALKVVLMLFIPMVFELSVISISIHLLEKIDHARIERQKVGEIVSCYVNVFVAILGDYIGFVSHMDNKEVASSAKVHSLFDRTRSAFYEMEKRARAAGFDLREVRKVTVKARRRLGLIGYRSATVTKDQFRKKVEALNLLGDIIDTVDKLISDKIGSLRIRETLERELFLKLSTVLIVALIVSLLLTLGLCMFLSKIIVERIIVIRSNMERLASKQKLLPPLRGEDEIAQLDKNFRAMAETLDLTQERDRLILDNSIDVICALNKEHNFQWISDSSELVWSRAPLELVNNSIADVLDSECQLDTFKKFDEAMDSGVTQTFENETVTLTGEKIPSMWSVQWSDKDQMFICVVHDLTGRKLAEVKRQELLALVSHDLRTPLTTAKLSLDLLLADPKLEPVLEKELSLVNRSISYVIGVTNDLLDLLRIQQDRIDIALKLSTMGDFQSRLKEYLEDQEIQCNIFSDVASDSYLMLDEEFLPRVFLALVRHINLSCSGRLVTINISSDNSNENFIFHIEPSDEQLANSKQIDGQNELNVDSALRISFEVSLTMCQEIAARLKGRLRTSWTAKGMPVYELILPAASMR